MGVPPGAGAPAAAVSDGGDGLVALDGGKWFGEHRWSPRKLATGSFGREEGRRRGFRGRPVSGGANGGDGRLWTPWGARLGAWSREGSRGGGRRLTCEANGREESRAEGASELRSGARHGSVRRRRGASSSRPQRARSEMAPCGEAERLRENQGRGSARERCVAAGLDSDGDLGSAQNRGGRERREREKQRLTDSNSKFSQKFRLKLGKP